MIFLRNGLTNTIWFPTLRNEKDYYEKHIPVKKTVKTSDGVIWVYPLCKVYSSLYSSDKVILDQSQCKVKIVHIVRRDIVIGKSAFTVYRKYFFAKISD